MLQRFWAFASLYYCYVLAGFLLLRHAIRPFPTLLGASLEPVRLVLGDPIYHYRTAQAMWFSRSLVCVGTVTILYLGLLLLRPLVGRRPATSEERERVRRILQEHGTDTLSYFALQDGRSYFLIDPAARFFPTASGTQWRLWPATQSARRAAFAAS